jgi:hypothetical protein
LANLSDQPWFSRSSDSQAGAAASAKAPRYLLVEASGSGANAIVLDANILVRAVLGRLDPEEEASCGVLRCSDP